VCTVVGQVERRFANLPRAVEWRSYLEHDLPLLKLPEPVKALAISEKLNKRLSEVLGDLYHKAPQKFAQFAADGGVRAWDDLCDWTARRGEIRPLAEVSVREMRVIIAHETMQQVKSRPAPVVTPAFPDGTYRCLVIDPHGRWTKASASRARRRAITSSTR
jgi:hypothetical protein